MSRAFVKESDDGLDDLPERPVSTAPNWVTPEGLAAIDCEIARLTSDASRLGEDRYARARHERDLRYWKSRRASAQVINAPPSLEIVAFGATVTIDRDDGRRETFRIVGEDEADPAHGAISYVSPLARALMGKSVDAVVRVGERAVTLVKIN